MSQTVTVVNPLGRSAAQASEDLAKLLDLEGASIALVDSRRPNSIVFTNALEKVLTEAGAGSIKRYQSLAVGIPLPEDMLRQIIQADAAIYGVTD